MTVIPIVVGAFRTIPKVLGKILKELKIRGRLKTIQTIIVKIKYSEVFKTSEETGCHQDFSEIPPPYTNKKNLQGVK